MQLWSHWAVAVTFLSWAEADIVRYLWYALSLAGSPPHLLTWLRCRSSCPAYPSRLLMQLALIGCTQHVSCGFPPYAQGIHTEVASQSLDENLI